METDDELLARYKRVNKMLGELEKKAEKKKGYARSQAFMFCGSIAFTVATMETEMRSRGLTMKGNDHAN